MAIGHENRYREKHPSSSERLSLVPHLNMLDAQRQSPVLFNIDSKLLEAVIRRFGVQCHLYADDTHLCFSIISESGEAVTVLNQCLHAVRHCEGQQTEAESW